MPMFGSPRRQQTAQNCEQHQDGQFGGDAGGHDGDGLTERRCPPFAAIPLLADQIGKAGQQHDDKEQETSQRGRHLSITHRCGRSCRHGDVRPDDGISETGKDGQVNTKLHTAELPDPQGQHSPLVLENAELPFDAPRW